MECPNCGAYNAEERTQCWKCDDLLPSKPAEKPRQARPGGMSMFTWVILIILGAFYLFNQCRGPIAPPTSHLPPAHTIVELI